MHNISTRQCGYGLIAALALGLTGCYMDDPMRDPMNTNAREPNAVLSTPGTAAKATPSSDKEPVQQSGPGPKHSQAPQLPVL